MKIEVEQKKLADGTIHYYLNGLLHRLDGPAVENENGLQCYYLLGQLHRLDGPAYCTPHANVYFLWGSLYSEEAHRLMVQKLKLGKNETDFKIGMESI